MRISGVLECSASLSPREAAERIAETLRLSGAFRVATGVKPAEVEVHTAADGTILQTRLIKLSGTREWDETVVQAIQKMERLPLDGFGRVPPAIIFHISPTQLQ